MKPVNLISLYQGASALEAPGIDATPDHKILKPREIVNLESLCSTLRQHGCTMSDFDGYFVGFKIDQIGKEFDLLRFGSNYSINIEIKDELDPLTKEDKILKQLRKNHYYLKSLGRDLRMFTYVENDGFYEYLLDSDSIEKTTTSAVASCIRSNRVDYSIDPSKEFIPSNYLVSPFNSTSRFLNGEYFLTSAQQQIKNDIFSEIEDTPFMYFTISANAGTGKTLLMYDIAKDMIQQDKNVIIIHCGMLNGGHATLRDDHYWNILPIRSISSVSANTFFDNVDMIFIDEAQRIRNNQLELIIQKSLEKQIPIIFSYDVNQYLKNQEKKDIEAILSSNYPDIKTAAKRLTTKIRTNKKMASFITNLRNIGRSNDNLDYDCVSIDYFNTFDDLIFYLDFLKQNGWTAITYTASQYSYDPYSVLSKLCDKNAHSVIGQEFSKVVFVMDENFYYDGNRLVTNPRGYYDADGMLYQIVTRVVDELKIIIFNNPALYSKVLDIKAMGK